MDRKDQRVCIKFCVKNEKTETEIYDMLQKAYGKTSLSRYIVYEWVRCFKKDRDLMKDDLWMMGRQSIGCNDVNLDKLRQMVQDDQRLDVKEMAREIGIGFETCLSMLTVNLGLRWITGRLVPRFLSDELRTRRHEISLELRRRTDGDPTFLDSVISGDEIWIYGSYSSSVHNNNQTWRTEPAWLLESRSTRGSSKPATKIITGTSAAAAAASCKTLLIVFFDSQGIVHQEFVPQYQKTLGQTYYKEVLVRLREKIRTKRPQLYGGTLGGHHRSSWFLQHDAAPGHNSVAIREYLAAKRIPVLPHPSYSPDLSPCDFFLFPRIKEFLKDKTFDEPIDVKRSTLAYLQSIVVQDFRDCFENLRERWSKCIAAKGEYFETDRF